MNMAIGVVHGCSSGPIVALVSTDDLFYGTATAVLRSDESKRLALYPPGPPWVQAHPTRILVPTSQSL